MQIFNFQFSTASSRAKRVIFNWRTLIVLLMCAGTAYGQTYSDLWGKSGECWSAQSRLPDFSYAGYHKGERAIPDVPAVANVKAFGAVGDGVQDDTNAILAAIDSVNAGAIEIPAGRYVITRPLRITKGNIVLRGAGIGKTVLVIPKSLQAIAPADPYSGGNKLRYSFGGAFVAVRGRDDGKPIGKIGTPAKRGDTQLVLSEKVDVAPGDWVRMTMNADSTLGRHLHADERNVGKDTIARRKTLVDWVAQVVSVDGGQVTVDRPLRVDVRLEWEPMLYTFVPTVSEVGIEGLTFEFPGVPKKKHLLEEGFNAIQIQGVINCWVRNVEIVDADLGIKIDGRARFCQVEDVLVRAEKREGITGHHVLWASGNAQDCLFQDFRIETRYVHDLTVEGLAHGNVFRNGSGVSMNLDHHRNAPYENLFTNLNVGNARRLWRSSGRGDRGPHSGARTTAWHIQYDGEKLQKAPKWAQINIVGVVGYEEEKGSGRWIEPIGNLEPKDLYAAQLERRLLNAAKEKTYVPINLRPLMDGMSHWRKRFGRDRNDPMYDPSQIVQIAENMLSFQNADGGFSKNVDWQAEIDPDTVRTYLRGRALRSTLDNHNTFTQIEYLAQVYLQTGLDRYRRGAERGLDYIFREQRPTGGWRGWDVDAITYNDGVMIGVMELLRDIVDGKPQFAWLNDDWRAKAKASLDRAIDVTLKAQIVVNGKKTAWCQQHDHETLKPVKARSYELPAICPGESSSIVRFLMAIEDPSPEVVNAVDCAVQWFEEAKIEGIRVERVTIDAARFKNHTAMTDVVVVKDPNAPPLWGRYHEIDTFEPFFCNRDGIKVKSLAEVKLERRTGYAWYGGWPNRILQTEYPAWRKRLSEGE